MTGWLCVAFVHSAALGPAREARAAPRPPASQPAVCEVFRHRGKDWYRIPSLVVTKKGTLLAFASRRKGSLGDFGHDSDVVLRRSTDGGSTWQPMRTLVRKAGIDAHHGPALVDPKTGRIWKFCRYWPAKAPGGPHRFVSTTPYEKMRAAGYIDHVVTSDDDGRTWTAPAALALPFPRGARSGATGNGNHGIVLAGGRMLIQGGYVAKTAGKEVRHICVFLSDDGGKTWRMGADVDGGGIIREFALAEVGPGRVYYNSRSNDGQRRVAWSATSGEAFGRFALDKALPGPRCHAGLVALDPPSAKRVRLAFSCPGHRHTGGGSLGTTRRRLTVYLSSDGGRTWPIARVLHEGPAAYSDLAALPDGTLACLFERGEKSAYDGIALATFPVDWLQAARGPRRQGPAR